MRENSTYGLMRGRRRQGQKMWLEPLPLDFFFSTLLAESRYSINLQLSTELNESIDMVQLVYSVLRTIFEGSNFKL